MDSRLQLIGGGRIAPLCRHDIPRLAQAIVDAVDGKARIRSGISKDTSYVMFIRDHVYTVVVRGDDWKKIFPLFRYSTATYTPVQPPGNQPAPIPSPQPNRVMQPPPEIPDTVKGLTSFLEGLPYHEYVKIQQVLALVSFDSFDRPVNHSRPARPIPYPPYVTPTRTRTDGTTKEVGFYNLLVQALEQLFPEDYPTRF